MTPQLGEVVGRWLERAGLERAILGATVVRRWPELVGPGVARHARAETVRRGVLTVRVDSNVWATELAAHRPALLERINTAMGQAVVSEVRFLVGPGPASGSAREGEAGAVTRWPDRRDLASVSLTEEDRAKVEAFRAAAADPELAEAGARWLTATLRARRWAAERAGRTPSGLGPSRGGAES